MSIIEKMITQLKAGRESMFKQINLVNEISEKSNNLLLHMEVQRAKENEAAAQNPATMKPYSYNKEMEHLLTKSIEIYDKISKEDLNETTDQGTISVFEFLERNKQNNQHLNNNVRKTLVTSDIMEKVTLDKAKEEETLIEN